MSIVTVSRAFNNSPLVNAKTRTRVLDAARELGYRPNSAARALSKGKANSVAVVLRPLHLFGEFHMELLGGIHTVVQKRDLSVLLAVSPEDGDTASWLRQMVSAAAVDALVLHHEIVREVGPELVESLMMPVVVAGHIAQPGKREQKLSFVGFDHADGIQQALRHIVSLGHRQIAYLDNPGTVQSPSTRERAFRAEMGNLGLPLREDWLVICRVDDDPAEGSRVIHQILGRRPPYPTAVLCGSDFLAAGVISGARAWGKVVPEDISVVGYGDAPWILAVDPPLTSVHQRGGELGVAVGEKLLACCDNNFEETGVTNLTMRLVVRRSTAPPNFQPTNGLTQK